MPAQTFKLTNNTSYQPEQIVFDTPAGVIHKIDLTSLGGSSNFSGSSFTISNSSLGTNETKNFTVEYFYVSGNTGTKTGTITVVYANGAQCAAQVNFTLIEITAPPEPVPAPVPASVPIPGFIPVPTMPVPVPFTGSRWKLDINDNSFGQNPDQTFEGAMMSIHVSDRTRSVPAGDLYIPYSITGISPLDIEMMSINSITISTPYNGVPPPLTGNLRIFETNPATVTVGTGIEFSDPNTGYIFFTIKRDGLSEPMETVTVTVGSPPDVVSRSFNIAAS